MWDGAVYLRCLEEAFGPQRGAAFLFCANHPTGGYLTPLAIALHLSGMRYAAVIAVNVLLAALAAHSVADLSALMFPGAEHRAERALVTLGFALSPLLIASAVQLTPDFGVAVFSICAARALARERPGLAALYGALSCLSKETGGVIYVLSCAAYLLVYVAWSPRTGRPLIAALRRNAVLAAALVPAALWLATRRLQRGDRAAWQGVGTELPIWRQVLSVSWLDNVLPSQLAEIFVLNFGWVLSAFILAHALDCARRWIVRAPPRDLDLPSERAARFVTFAFLGVVFAVTRIRTFVMPRYVLPAVVFMPLLGQLALHSLGVQRRQRLLVLGLFAALSTLAIFRSQDGISMLALGSFPFGSQRLIDVAAWTHEAPSRRDHAVYNLEFTWLARLLDDALPYALADGRHELALNRQADWWLIGCVDPSTHRRVICTPTRARTAPWTLATLRRSAEHPRLLYYIELPGMEDEDELIGWSQLYRVGEARAFTRRGYAIGVRELRLRDDAPASQP